MSFPNIMVEGVDCVGKTTFINLFVERNPQYKIIKMKNPKNYEDGKEKNLKAFQMLNNESGLIFDRGILGECVYSPIKRRYYPEYVRMLEQSIKGYNVLLLLTADPKKIIERFDNVFLTVEEIPLVIDAFNREFEASLFPIKIRINVDGKTPLEIVNIVEEKLKCFM